MKQFLAFAFILLITLSTINAAPLQKRETQFGKCPNIPKVPQQPDFITVSVSPDPITPSTAETFSISATFSKPITPDYNIIIGFADFQQGKILGDPTIFEICTGETKCPIEPGTKYSTSKQVTSPKELPAQYAIEVAITTLPNPPDIPDIIGCAISIVGDSTSATATESYPIPVIEAAAAYPTI